MFKYFRQEGEVGDGLELIVTSELSPGFLRMGVNSVNLGV